MTQERTTSAHLGHARKVADAILYEGYLLYPYRSVAEEPGPGSSSAC